MSIETEIKIKLKNPEEVRQKIISLGAKSLGKKRQLDIYFDTEDEEVRGSDQVRKLRIIQDDVAILTYKGARGKDEIDAGIHKRLELETRIKDPENIRAILKGWGHKETEQSEKIRETFKYEGAEILIDQVAFLGWWIELEGDKEKILDVANKLGFDATKADKRHYGEIFADFCRETGCPFTKEMTFEKEKLWLTNKIN
jgi:adenylate cyclase class 2